MFCPKLLHKKNLKRLGCYLKVTCDKGLILCPSSEILKMDCYTNADFMGMYGYESNSDPACAKSCTGYITAVDDCPVLWQSKLQTKTTLSNMEAKIVALAHSCRDLFPIIGMVALMSSAIGLLNPENCINS